MSETRDPIQESIAEVIKENAAAAEDTLAPESPSSDEPTTMAFIADKNTSTLVLRQTVKVLLDAKNVQRVFVDLSTLAGVVVAGQCLVQGIPYLVLDYGQEPEEHSFEGSKKPTNKTKSPKPRPYRHSSKPSLENAPHLRSRAAGLVEVPPDQLGEMPSLLVLVPAAEDVPGSQRIDFSLQSLCGVVIAQAEKAKRQILVMVPPEQGLIRDGDKPNAYLRRTMLVDPDA